jgi:hypothetical protein
MSAFTNLAFANNALEAITNKQHHIDSLLKVEGIFLNTSTRWQFTLRTDYQARWAAAAVGFQALLANGSAIGFFLGDELLWNGLSFTDMGKCASAVRSTFPTGSAIIYTNAAWPTQLPTMPGQPQRMGSLAAVPNANLWLSVPPELDWFSVDVRCSRGAFVVLLVSCWILFCLWFCSGRINVVAPICLLLLLSFALLVRVQTRASLEHIPN